MPRVPETLIAEARARVDLPARIGRRVRLTRTGGGAMVGRCPYHAERTGSFTVYADHYHCYGCGAHGSALDWLIHGEGLDYGAAVRALLAWAGLPWSDDAPPPEGTARPTRAEARKAARQARRAHKARQREADAEAAAQARQRADTAREEWRHADRIPAPAPVWDAASERNPVVRYLLGRGCLTHPRQMPPSLRWSSALRWVGEDDGGGQVVWVGPAMVAAIQRGGPDSAYDGAGDPVIAVHRTWVRPDGAGKAPVAPAKKVLGPMAGGCVRLTPAAPVLVIAEGIETGLSVCRALRLTHARGSRLAAAPDIGVWCGVSLGNIAGRALRGAVGETHPDRAGQRLPAVTPDPAWDAGLILPRCVREVILCGERDARDPPAYDALIRRAVAGLRARGRLARVAWPSAGGDFNDLLRAGAA